MEFVIIPPGRFLMGSNNGDDDERPAHEVRITKGFEMAQYEVTQAQWDLIMRSAPSEFKDRDRPVENVSWNDAQEFLRKLNQRNDGYRYRLPTEAEWEYAARAGTTGDYAGELYDMAWYRNNSDFQTHRVGLKKPNAWGLYDMHGNVWEWCQDWYEKTYYASSPAADPQGPASGKYRIARGGSWQRYGDLRVSYRQRYGPSTRLPYVGFRCVREVVVP